jgi:hypothetical protein
MQQNNILSFFSPKKKTKMCTKTNSDVNKQHKIDKKKNLVTKCKMGAKKQHTIFNKFSLILI